MGKSYKKKPFYKAHRSDAKKMANDRVRVTKDIPNGGAYKKFFPQWDVIDYTIYRPWNKKTEERYFRWNYTSEECRSHWEKHYYRK